MLIFCAIATPRPRAPTSCNPFVRRFNVACTPAQPQSCLYSHKHGHSAWEDKKQVRKEGDVDDASLTQHAIYEHVSHKGDCSWVQQAHSNPFASIVASMLPLHHPATHAIPRPTILHPAVPGPCMRFVQDALQSMPAWAARPLCSHSLWKMHRECTGVFGVQLLSSGRKSVASRLLPVASAFGCFQLLCTVQILSHHTASCTQHTPHAKHTHHLHLHATRTLHAVHLTHSALTTHPPCLT